MHRDMIQFKDFVPKQTAAPGLLKAAEYDSFDQAANAATHWADAKGIRVINIETVVLSNIYHSFEEGTNDASLSISGEMSSSWHQFVRVWYEEA